MSFGRLGKSPLYLILLLGSLLSLGTASSVPQELDISFNHDLIYLDVRNGNVMRWPAGEVGPEILVGPSEGSLVQTAGKVVALSSSDSGHDLALTVALDEQGYELIWLLLASLEIHTVETFALQPEVKVSPNGHWIAYREEESTEIFTVRADALDEKLAVGICNEVENHWRTLTCIHFYWSPNSTQLAWSDGVGLWIAQPPLGAKKVINNYIFQREYEGGDDLVTSYDIDSWSPGSRYLVLNRPVYIEGSDKVLLDARNGNSVRIPGTYRYSIPELHMIWLDESRFSAIHGDYSFTRGPRLDVWQADPLSAQLLVSDSKYFYGIQCGIVTDTGLYGEESYYYVVHTTERDNCEEAFTFTLYIAPSPGSFPTLALRLPDPDNQHSWPYNLLWAPDKETAILFFEGWSLLNLEQGMVEDLTPIIGDAEDICCFTWVE